MSDLLDKQQLFVALECQFVAWCLSRGWKLTHGEGFVGDTDAKDGDHDGPHKAGGAHYTKTGADWNLFVPRGGEYVLLTSSDEPEWKEAGAFWKSLSPDCAWGGDFPKPDGNHLSLRWGGRA